MSNIYDTANQLERDLRELQEFKTVKEIGIMVIFTI